MVFASTIDICIKASIKERIKISTVSLIPVSHEIFIALFFCLTLLSKKYDKIKKKKTSFAVGSSFLIFWDSFPFIYYIIPYFLWVVFLHLIWGWRKYLRIFFILFFKTNVMVSFFEPYVHTWYTAADLVEIKIHMAVLLSHAIVINILISMSFMYYLEIMSRLLVPRSW